MEIKCKMFPDESKEFPWDKNALKIFKQNIKDKEITCRMDDIFLLGFLRARKYDQERSLRLLVNYYTRRCEYPNFFKNLIPSKMELALSFNALQYMPNPDQDGRYIFISKFENWDISVVDANELFRYMLLFHDFQLNFHRTQENGIVVINDGAGLTLRHLLYCNPRFINSTIAITIRDSYQLRFKELHYVNVNVIVKAVLSLLIPLLPFKIKKRVFLHSDMSTLHKYIHPQYLPAEYGGELPNFDPTEAIEMLKENEEFFRMNEEFVRKFEKGKNQKFTEGRFRYTNEDQEEERFQQLLEDTEAEFRALENDPEKYISRLEQKPDLEITHF